MADNNNNPGTFISRNWQWMLTVVVMVVINYTTVANKVDTKVNREEVRQLVKEEIKESVYTRTEGKVLEARFDNFEKKLDNIDNKVSILVESKKNRGN